MTLTWPVPRSEAIVSPYLGNIDHIGGTAAAADLVRLGVLTPLFDGAYGLTDQQTVQMRAAALAAHIWNGSVIGLDTAAWIYTGLGYPRNVFVWQSRGRHRPPPHRRRIVRSRELSARQVVTIEGVPLTTAAVTLRDLLNKSKMTSRTAPDRALSTVALPDLIASLQAYLRETS